MHVLHVSAWHAARYSSRMTSQPATPPLNLAPDRIFGPLDQDLAHRTSLLPPAKKPVVPFTLPLTSCDPSPSYCAWPSAIVGRS
jgi:hypothetical protein